MVKYYFQSMNGSITFVHAGTKEELKDLVEKKLGGDKEEVKARIKASIEEKEKELAELMKPRPLTEEEDLENDCRIANLKKGLFMAKREYERVDELIGKDLVFFELTPVEL